MLIILLVLALFQPAAAQKTEWKGTIATENNVNVIRNPAKPLYGELKLDLQEEISIGREDDKNYLFWAIADVQVDPEGNIYVVDMKNCRVQKFDRAGNYVTTLGRKGQGPGEFEFPRFVRVDPKAMKYFIRDSPISIIPFDKDSRPLDKMTWNKVIYDFYPLSNGEFLAVLDRSDEARLVSMKEIVKIGANRKIMRTIAEHPHTIFMQRYKDGVMAVSTGYELDLHVAKIDEGAFVYGYSKDYELTVINADGTVLNRIIKDAPRPAFTAAEKAQYKRIPVPELKPHFFALLADSQGRIYVQRNFTHTGKSNVSDAIPKEVDIFSRDGYFLYTAALPPSTTVIRDGTLYSYLVDEDKGLETVKRYKIRNWSQIKSGRN
jgi:hypothetical protein